MRGSGHLLFATQDFQLANGHSSTRTIVLFHSMSLKRCWWWPCFEYRLLPVPDRHHLLGVGERIVPKYNWNCPAMDEEGKGAENGKS